MEKLFAWFFYPMNVLNNLVYGLGTLMYLAALPVALLLWR